MKRIAKLLLVTLAIFLLYNTYLKFTTLTVKIFFTNDIHGWIFPQKAGWIDGEPLVGGMSVLASLLKKEKGYYLLLDAGDFFQGTPEGDFTKGESLIECMNQLGYTAVTVGNHEYDLGEKNLIKLTKQANFPFLGANIYSLRTKKRVEYVKPYIVKEIKGVKFGIFGITTQEMGNVVLSKSVRNLRFGRESSNAEAVVKELKEIEKADIIIGLTHIGVNNDQKLADKVEGIDFIIGGHSHTGIEKAIEIKNTPIVQTYGKLTAVGEITLQIDRTKKKIKKYRYQMRTLYLDKYGEEGTAKKIVDKHRENVGKVMDVVIGETTSDLKRSMNGESNIGNWQTDLMRKFTSAEIGFQNSGGIRIDLKKGKLTLRDIYNLSPFDNTLVVMELTGDQIKEILETSISGKFGFLQFSGIKVEYDPTLSKGSKVLNIFVGNKPLQRGRFYKVVTNNFVAGGGDGFKTFLRGRNIKDTKIKLRDAEVEFVKKYSPFSAEIDGRIINILEK